MRVRSWALTRNREHPGRPSTARGLRDGEGLACFIGIPPVRAGGGDGYRDWPRKRRVGRVYEGESVTSTEMCHDIQSVGVVPHALQDIGHGPGSVERHGVLRAGKLGTMSLNPVGKGHAKVCSQSIAVLASREL
jgi:hypothetical protein